jgi:plastocyanin
MKKSICTNRKLWSITVLLLISSLIMSGCSKSQNMLPYIGVQGTTLAKTGGTPANSVEIHTSAFTPGIITVPLNATVTWTNKSGVVETVTSDAGLFDSGNIAQNGSYSHLFTAAGTYYYHSAYNSMVKGTVIVNPAAAGNGAGQWDY